MTINDNCLVWDFGGTLGYRDGLVSGAMYQAIEDILPSSRVTLDEVRRTPKSVFPWDAPEEPHPHIESSEQWWNEVLPRVSKVFAGLDFSSDHADELALRFRSVFTNPAGFSLFEDTVDVLRELRQRGYLNVILSNHVPELEEIVFHLGIREFFEDVFCSALIGYEKPNPSSYEHVRSAFGARYRFVMIGDSPNPDVVGPEAVGMQAILVRGQHRTARNSVENLHQLPELLGEILA